ncbi:MAG TPA: inositol monophosphatase family protein [Sphingomicrobium sp.]|nr:inositol monophosphatase family protein [Sphingomicrobium sp.]
MDLQAFARFANELADLARAHTLAVDTAPRVLTNKAFTSAPFDPVTRDDRLAEAAMRSLILARFPDHAVSGEEGGRSGPEQAHYCWSLDPIDGTRSFICGLPSWTTLIALLEGGGPVLGLIDAPRLGQRYLAYGEKAVLITPQGETPLRTSECRTLADARFSTTDPFLFEGSEFDTFDRLRSKVKITRFGLDGYAYARLAAGTIDLVVESGLKAHDFNALIPVVRCAGGTIGDWWGADDFSRGAIIAAATDELYRKTVDTLAS